MNSNASDMQHILPKRELITALIALCTSLALAISALAQGQESRSGGGLTVYLGVVPAEIIKGPSPHSAERPMHGRSPRGPHEYHLVAALFDAATGARVSDAAVTAQVLALGLSGSTRKLEPMQIAGTTTFGGFFSLPGRDVYTVKLTVDRPGGVAPVVVNFKFDHRR